jgi:tRNA(fMet)-specific endonuclease VapC
MKRYMLDTNAVSHLLKGHPAITGRVVAGPMAALCISAITEGELLFGLARRPEARRLAQVVREFLLRVDVMPWDSAAAGHYATVRVAMTARGAILAPLDMLIAAHALAISAVLVTSDRAFGQVTDLRVEDWTAL